MAAGKAPRTFQAQQAASGPVRMVTFSAEEKMLAVAWGGKLRAGIVKVVQRAASL